MLEHRSGEDSFKRILETSVSAACRGISGELQALLCSAAYRSSGSSSSAHQQHCSTGVPGTIAGVDASQLQASHF